MSSPAPLLITSSCGGQTYCKRVCALPFLIRPHSSRPATSFDLRDWLMLET